MFDTLSERLGGIFDGLTGRGALSEKDVNAALREIRVALLEADVALPVVKDFIDSVRARAVGEEVIRSVKPGQQVIKIVCRDARRRRGRYQPAHRQPAGHYHDGWSARLR